MRLAFALLTLPASIAIAGESRIGHHTISSSVLGIQKAFNICRFTHRRLLVQLPDSRQRGRYSG